MERGREAKINLHSIVATGQRRLELQRALEEKQHHQLEDTANQIRLKHRRERSKEGSPGLNADRLYAGECGNE